MAMSLVSTVTVGSGGAASIQFDNIPQSGKDLLILVSMKIVKLSGNPDALEVRFNGDTGSNYTTRWLEGSGSSVASANTTTGRIYIERGAMPSYYTANTFGNAGVYVANYTSAVAKSVSGDAVTENNATASYQTIAAGSWTGTSAISSLTVFSGSSTITEFSSASLYIVS
jgi:hypothetical protein